MPMNRRQRDKTIKHFLHFFIFILIACHPKKLQEVSDFKMGLNYGHDALSPGNLLGLLFEYL